MKKVVSILLVVLILGTTATAFASMEDRLAKHWSRSYIEKEFLTFYFPYLARDNFKRLDPNGTISKQDIAASLASLSKDCGLDTKSTNLGIDGALTREELVVAIGEKIVGLNLSNDKTKAFPFKDINTMDNSSIELLRLLYNLDIIYGVSATEFRPSNKLSQAEAIIILQRLKGVLKPMEEISFNTMGMMQSYNNKESIIVKDLKDKVTVTITKAFPTPGYSLSVDKIMDTKDGYEIYLETKSPSKDSMQLQVITYKTITVEIDKQELIKPAPYRFIVEGDGFPSGL